MTSRTEVRVADIQGRPDVGVLVHDLLCGYIELKAPEIPVNPAQFRGANKRQWDKFKALPNLIYTNGSEWRLFRSGEQIGRVVRFGGDASLVGADAIRLQDAEALERVFIDFLNWEPIVPATPNGLASAIAPICRLIRDDVLLALSDEDSNLSILAGEWRDYLFPDTDNARFSDAYAQTLTYALLLARLSGEENLRADNAAEALRSGHGLLARVLEIFSDPQAREEIRTGADLLERIIAAIPVERLRDRHPDLWLYFYEDFLAAYDPALRKDYGVYYTPAQVVQCQVRLVGELLENRFERQFSFADEGVIFLDPGVGTGTYPIAAIQHALERVREVQGPGAAPARATLAAQNMHAFEILVGPYAVAHLRLTQEILAEQGELPADGVHVYLADTLESPYVVPPGQLDLQHRPLVEENRRARRIKAETRVLVCMGNPPYDRQVIDPEDTETHRKGGWVRFADGGSPQEAIFRDFLDPAREAGHGVHLKNLYNDYVYFWRWALWKVLEDSQNRGIISFITASSYLRGPGFVAMRQLMRQLFDEIWIIDLEGDNLGARRTENVFNIQTPVAIAIGIRDDAPDPESPAIVRYTKITGTREAKLARLAEIERFADLEWQVCFSGWMQPFLPETEGDFFNWPLVTNLFPWQHSGVQFKRTWPIAPTEEVLRWRWRSLTESGEPERAEAFRETSARRINKIYTDWRTGQELPAVGDVAVGADPPRIERYGYRSFDRQYVFSDNRFSDRPRPPLWLSHSQHQIYLTSLLTGVLGEGPAATVNAHVPDLHHFRGSFGGKGVIPLWRDADGTTPNITAGLLELLERAFEEPVSPEDFFSYCYGILASPAYVDRFSEELTIPGPHIPITTDRNLFPRMVDLGSRLVWFHTYGERLVPEGETVGRVPTGEALCTRPISSNEAGYPDDYSYDPDTRELRVGTGQFAPVAPEVFTFTVSGLEVVQSWLSYRMRQGAGRQPSPLNEIRPRRWNAAMTDELLALLWILEHTIATYSDLDETLSRIIDGPVISTDDLPMPSDEERMPPNITPQESDQLGLGV